jgi:7-cyano-7-deazaguanine synthase
LPATIGLLFSGGIDSAILLLDLVEHGHVVQPLYIDSQLHWQQAEFKAARKFLSTLASSAVRECVVLQLPLADVYGDHWSISGRDIPQAGTPDEAVCLPGRNPLLIIKARLWCQRHRIRQLALGSLGTNPFSDATADFFERFEDVLNQSDDGDVRLVRPFAELDKRQVMQLARPELIALSFSCLAPQGEYHCGRCNKCEERQAAFRLIDARDPTEYAAATIGSDARVKAP